MGATEAAGTAADCKPLRLLHWNILDGGGSRLRGIGDVVRTGRYDLVSLNELNGVSESRLGELGHEWGFGHAKLLQKSPYHLGLLSKHPLRLRANDAGRDFVHGLLCVDVLNMTLCVTHLNPHDVGRRLSEARAIVRRVPPDRPFLLAGDLNTLSSLDRAIHESAGLARATIQLVITAGRPPVRSTSPAWCAPEGVCGLHIPCAVSIAWKQAIAGRLLPAGYCRRPARQGSFQKVHGRTTRAPRVCTDAGAARRAAA